MGNQLKDSKKPSGGRIVLALGVALLLFGLISYGLDAVLPSEWSFIDLVLIVALLGYSYYWIARDDKRKKEEADAERARRHPIGSEDDSKLNQ